MTHGIKITKKTRMYKCPVCRIKKTSVQLINEHFRRRHKKVKCKICGKQFNNPSSRDKHMYNHQSQKRYPCDQCDKEFPFKSMLDDHRAQHTMAKHYPCLWPGCKCGFSYSWDLKKHITAHKNANKPKHCKHCDYTNADPRNLKQHTCTHTDEKPHKCKFCGQGFRFWVQKKHHQEDTCPKKWQMTKQSEEVPSHCTL